MAGAISFGELLIDMVSEAADVSLQEAPGFLKAPGGAPANVAVGLARLGVPTKFIGQVGDDPFGHWLRAVVAHEGVDVGDLFTSATARTTIAFVATRSDGRKDICFYRNPGADATLEPGQLTPAMFQDARVFHCCSVSFSESPCREAQFEAVRLAAEQGALISFDPNWRPSLWSDFDLAHRLIWQMIPLSHVVKVADEEWEFITGTTDFAAGARGILESGPSLVVITRGANGACYFTAQGSGEVPGHAVQAIDTLGAGDAFVAGLLYRLLQHPSLEDALRDETMMQTLAFANACGALATLKPGAIPALPMLAEVEQFNSCSDP